MEGPQPTSIAGPRWQRDVDRRTLRVRTTRLAGTPRAREERGRRLVQAHGQHPRIVVEDRLYAVPVMHVDVDVRDPLSTVVEQPLDRDGGVVVDAETAGLRRHRVMQSAGDVGGMQDVALPDRPGRLDRRADD